MDIECERCGDCCPKDCDHLRILRKEPHKTSCELHGTGRQSQACSNSPRRLFRYGIACGACIAYIREEIDETVNLDTYTDHNGRVVIEREKIPREIFLKVISNGDDA